MRAYGIAAMLAVAGWTGQALAAPCYVIYDRNDAVVYRDYAPPFDLSDPNAPERAMMRQQKQHLLVAEFEKCNPVGYISPTTGGTTATVDEIVQQLQPAVATSMSGGPGVRGSAATSPRPGMTPATPAASARAAPAAAPKTAPAGYK